MSKPNVTFKLKFKPNGFAKIRKAPGVVAKLDDVAEAVAARATQLSGITFAPDERGETGFIVDSTVSKGNGGRARSSVRTVGWEAMEAEARNRVLLRALDAAR